MIGIFSKFFVAVNDMIESLDLLFSGDFSNHLDGHGILFIDLFLEGIYFVLDVHPVVYFCHPLFELLLELHAFLLDLVAEVVVLALECDDLFALVEVVLFDADEVALFFLLLEELGVFLVELSQFCFAFGDC